MSNFRKFMEEALSYLIHLKYKKKEFTLRLFVALIWFAGLVIVSQYSSQVKSYFMQWLPVYYIGITIVILWILFDFYDWRQEKRFRSMR